ncbi:PTS cellobiose transporter subunit IIA [Bacillus safensis]|uniref:PTS cellobiose transporter subunit IIA n=1 Tax=Bacillus safensis TaxID=561879 RepID=A0A5S9MNC1_BACIA|nr:PTS cellobiose transporter subunit IIA [Bacillus safensis]
MTVLEEMQGAAFQIIAHAGEARSHYVEAIRLARADDFEKSAAVDRKKGEEAFRSIHNLHLSLIQKEAAEQLPFSLLLIHAEDQMLTTETIHLLAIEMIEMCKKMNTLSK